MVFDTLFFYFYFYFFFFLLCFLIASLFYGWLHEYQRAILFYVGLIYGCMHNKLLNLNINNNGSGLKYSTVINVLLFSCNNNG